MNDSTLPGAAPCVTPKIQRFLERLNRSRVEAVAQAAIDRLDELDGDPDDEESDEDCCSGFDDVGSSVVLHLDLPLRPGESISTRMARRQAASAQSGSHILRKNHGWDRAYAKAAGRKPEDANAVWNSAIAANNPGHDPSRSASSAAWDRVYDRLRPKK
ncbi:hypothetical protein [Sphingobium sp. CFD-2]|uniref:hypothetical protein n=1 Tax=Sphingobium sp. CFD-2 TaxID=2878542 RepID=UPI00214B7817|nr:hypothetical protein [Sphingobium sp. CFD-2]